MKLCCRLSFKPLIEFDDGKRKLDFKYSDPRLNVWLPSFTLEGVVKCKDELLGKFLHRGKVVDLVSVPCGKCVECLKARSEAWAARIVCEVQSLSSNHVGCFATLTYDDDHLPPGRSLSVKGIQKFLKRLRYFLFPLSLRYFLAGEYGPQTLRPHYHAIFLVEGTKDESVLDSAIRKAWPFGFLQLDYDVNFSCAAYVARYVDKKIEEDVKQSDYERLGLHPPFLLSSKGLGRDYAVKNADTLDYFGYVQLPKGRTAPLPRYFDSVLEKMGFSSNKEEKRKKAVGIVSSSKVHADVLGVSLGQWLSQKDSLMKVHKQALSRKDL